MEQVQYVDYSPALAPYFEAINVEWLERYFYVEDIDKEVLGNPEKYIIQPGGTIIFAKVGNQIAGTVALKLVSPGVFEMTKMGVSPEFQGLKLGEGLAVRILDKAREMGAHKVILYSSTKLKPAISLYRKLGFTELERETGHYERSDIKMEIPMNKAMNKAERDVLIQSYGTAYDRIIEALKLFPKEMWTWKPAPHKWSIQENIIHLADSEANAFARCRKFITEPGSTVMAYNQDKWAEVCNYQEQSAEDALELFRLLRKMSFDLIKKVSEETWNHTVEHPENGTMLFTDWLRIYENHTHINQMKRVFEAWKEFEKSGRMIYV